MNQSTYRFNICLLYEGVAVGSGWQSKVAYVNLACYYLIGIPLGVILGWVFNLGVEVCLYPCAICIALIHSAKFI